MVVGRLLGVVSETIEWQLVGYKVLFLSTI